MKQSENKKSLSEKNPVADFIFFRGIYCVPAAPHNLDAGSVVRATKRLKCIERGDSVVELDNFKSRLQSPTTGSEGFTLTWLIKKKKSRN